MSHDGNVTWLSMVIFKSSCAIDVKYFPFDTQNCSLDFSSWTYDSYNLNLLIQGDRVGDTTNYMNSTEWMLLEYLQEREVSRASSGWLRRSPRVDRRLFPGIYLFG